MFFVRCFRSIGTPELGKWSVLTLGFVTYDVNSGVVRTYDRVVEKLLSKRMDFLTSGVQAGCDSSRVLDASRWGP